MPAPSEPARAQSEAARRSVEAASTPSARVFRTHGLATFPTDRKPTESKPTDGKPASRSRRLIRLLVMGSGLGLLVIGTFLPWLISGGVRRNSYAIAALVDRLGLAGDGWPTGVLKAWPFLGPAVVAVVLLAVMRLFRTSGVLSAVVGFLVALLGIAALVAGSGRSAGGISVAALGPSVTAVGGLLSFLGGLAVALGSSRRASGAAPGRPAG